MDEDDYEMPSYVPESAKPRWEAWFRQVKPLDADNVWNSRYERDRARMFFFLGWIGKEDHDLVEATKGLN